MYSSVHWVWLALSGLLMVADVYCYWQVCTAGNKCSLLP